jgi:ferrochelatase
MGVHRLYFFYYYKNTIANVLSNIATVSNRVNLSRTVKPCSAGDRPGISVNCNLGWSSQTSPDLSQHFRGYSSASEAVLTAQSDLRKLLVGNEKIGVLLLNLGGPETLDDVQPFLFNLFADPVINILQNNTSF